MTAKKKRPARPVEQTLEEISATLLRIEETLEGLSGASDVEASVMAIEHEMRELRRDLAERE